MADNPPNNPTLTPDDALPTTPAAPAPVEGATIVVDGVRQPIGVYTSDPTARQAQIQAVAVVPAGQRPTLAQLLLGSVLVLTDEVGERIVVDESEVPATTRTPESVFRPVSEFEQLLGGDQYRQTRYLAIGAAGDARKAAERGLGFVNEVTDTAGRTFWRFAGPVWGSTLLSPVRRPVQRWRLRGEEQVQRWIADGMQQEARSRAVATASLNNLVQESVTDLTNNPEVQVLVQEVIQSQSVGLVGQIIQEIRERLLSMDIWIQGVFGSALATPPPFRDSYLRSLAQRRPQYEHADIRHSLAGYPAGFVSRFVAFVIDVMILLFAYTIGSAAITGTLNLFGLMDLVQQFMASGTILAQAAIVLVGLASFLLVAGYGILSWYLTGETIGHALVGVEVVDMAGGRVSLTRAIRRMIGVYVAAIPFFLGFIWVLFSKDRRGWHDMIGGTYMVHDWPAKPDEEFLNEHVAEEIAEDRLEQR
jgi:uncharacterized RDD family membrane protein YckC